MSAINAVKGAQKIIETGSNSALRVNAQRPVLSHKPTGQGWGCVVSPSLHLLIWCLKCLKLYYIILYIYIERERDMDRYRFICTFLFFTVNKYVNYTFYRNYTNYIFILVYLHNHLCLNENNITVIILYSLASQVLEISRSNSQQPIFVTSPFYVTNHW